MRTSGVIIALVSLMCLHYCSTNTTQEKCSQGWFGPPKCQYKCRCSDRHCDVNDGCLTGCNGKWFGPACQYYNIARLPSAKQPYTSAITDNNETTCTRWNGAKPLTITWSSAIPFTWLRLGVNEPGIPDNVSLLLKNSHGGDMCFNVTKAVINKKTLDIHCTHPVMVSNVTLSWNGVTAICYLYVSGGRNVALRQRSRQSSNYTYLNFEAAQSGNAVDGDTNGNFYDNSCTHTNTESKPYWYLNLSSTMQISRYIVYNRDSIKTRLKGFLLESFANKTSMPVFKYLDTARTAKDKYEVIDKNASLVKEIKISLNRTDVLTLCEVEAYGDSVCTRGRFGRDCERICKCEDKSETCFVSTGSCPSGCQAGFHGEGCQKPCEIGRFGKDCWQVCSYRCSSARCNAIDGACDGGCAQGYKPPNCNEECDAGFHGYNCTQPCSINCVGGICDGKLGKCLNDCSSGYFGDYCDKECESTKFGVNCRDHCSQECVATKCHHVTGFCNSCPPGKLGDHCEKNCSLGTFGINCSNSCSSNCAGSQGCNNVDGTCIEGCKSGYTLPLCDKPCEDGTYGQDCKSNCSQFCVVNAITKQSVCHHESGTCNLGCVNEYEEPLCVNLKLTDNGLSPGAVAGPILAVLLLAMLAIAAFFVWRWKQKQAKGSSSLASDSPGNETPSGFLALQLYTADKPQSHTNKCDLTPAKENDDVTYCNTTLEPCKTAIAVEDLNEFMLSHTYEHFVKQFKTIPSPANTSMSIGLSTENKGKNRYKNICAYDHSRVQLIADTERGHGDYINASYVQGYNNKNKFIASQGPSKVILEDFIRMLWEQKSNVVVMLTNLVEDGHHKCEKYWPEDDEQLLLGEIKIKIMNSQTFSDCIIRKMQLSKVNQKPHTLTQFHYLSWPDKDVPANPWSLVDFERRVASSAIKRPVVVHCSAGVGRTGTFIALCNVIRQAENIGFLDFYSTVSKLRQDRVNMIQTVNQYFFLHKAAQLAMVCLGTTLTTSDGVQRFKTLEEISASGQTNIEKEFRALCDVCTADNEGSEEEGSGGSVYQNSGQLGNRLKNRFSNILPKDSYRPHLFCETKEMGEYINAVLLPSLTNQNSQILTQLPLPTTIFDFWRLVTQFNVSLILAFEVETNDATVGAYLPPESNPVMNCGSFEIETKSRSLNALWEETELSITKHTRKRSTLSITSHIRTEECQVIHLKCTKSDLNPEDLLTVAQQVRSHRPTDKSKVLYMCRNGADLSGLLYVVSALLDRIDTDQQLMVPLVVGAVKNVRPQVIPTLGQYRMLYEVLRLYGESFNTYGNCSDQAIKMVTNAGVPNCGFIENENDDLNIYANS